VPQADVAAVAVAAPIAFFVGFALGLWASTRFRLTRRKDDE
jgi:hypothetical protein